jgi:hypothetical protein
MNQNFSTACNSARWSIKGGYIQGTRSPCKILTFRNVGNRTPNDTASHLRRPNLLDAADEVYSVCKNVSSGILH